MTPTEFNEKHKAFLEPGFEDQGLEFGKPETVKFLNNVFRDLTTIPGFTYAQIKWKFNSVRFYSSLKSSELREFIETQLKEIEQSQDN